MYTRVIHRRDEILHVDQVWLSLPLPFPLNQAALFFEFIHQLGGLVVGTVHGFHDLFQSANDKDPALVIEPSIFCREIHSLKKDPVEDLRLGRQAFEFLFAEEDCRDPDEVELVGLRAVEIVLHAYHHLLPLSFRSSGAFSGTRYFVPFHRDRLHTGTSGTGTPAGNTGSTGTSAVPCSGRPSAA